jgi:hypothetical protein
MEATVGHQPRISPVGRFPARRGPPWRSIRNAGNRYHSAEPTAAMADHITQWRGERRASVPPGRASPVTGASPIHFAHWAAPQNRRNQTAKWSQGVQSPLRRPRVRMRPGCLPVLSAARQSGWQQVKRHCRITPPAGPAAPSGARQALARQAPVIPHRRIEAAALQTTGRRHSPAGRSRFLRKE